MGIWFYKFYNPNYFGKTELKLVVCVNTEDWESGNFERLNEVISMRLCLEWYKQGRSENVPAHGPLLIITFVTPKV